MATNESRIGRLERVLGAEDDKATLVVVYDPASAPKDPAKRDAWLKSQRPDSAGPVFYIPDNGRNG